jgi:hypothetical protein
MNLRKQHGRQEPESYQCHLQIEAKRILKIRRADCRRPTTFALPRTCHSRSTNPAPMAMVTAPHITNDFDNAPSVAGKECAECRASSRTVSPNRHNRGAERVRKANRWLAGLKAGSDGREWIACAISRSPTLSSPASCEKSALPNSWVPRRLGSAIGSRKWPGKVGAHRNKTGTGNTGRW